MKLLGKLLSKKWNKILIFNAGSKSIEALEADLNLKLKKVRFKKFLQLEPDLGQEFQESDILSACEKIVKASSRKSALIFCFKKPFLKSTLSNFSIIRDNPFSLVDGAELENIISNLSWRLYDRERSLMDRILNASEFDISLVSSRIKEPRIEGRKILNPIGFSGKRLGFIFENTYSRRDFWEKLAGLIRRFKRELRVLAEDNLVFDRVFSVLDEGEILVEFGLKQVRIGIMGEFLKNFEILEWGEENLIKVISKELGISLSAAFQLKLKYESGDLSINSQRWFDRLLASELKLVAEGVDLALKNFSVSENPEKALRTVYLSGKLSRFPRVLELFNSQHWSREVFKRKPNVAVYTGDKIFDKINIKVENKKNFPVFDSPIFTVAIGDLFLPEAPYEELNKILRRRIKWLG